MTANNPIVQMVEQNLARFHKKMLHFVHTISVAAKPTSVVRNQKIELLNGIASSVIGLNIDSDPFFWYSLAN
jgi:hypothetical protein